MDNRVTPHIPAPILPLTRGKPKISDIWPMLVCLGLVFFQFLWLQFKLYELNTEYQNITQGMFLMLQLTLIGSLGTIFILLVGPLLGAWRGIIIILIYLLVSFLAHQPFDSSPLTWGYSQIALCIMVVVTGFLTDASKGKFIAGITLLGATILYLDRIIPIMLLEGFGNLSSLISILVFLLILSLIHFLFAFGILMIIKSAFAARRKRNARAQKQM